ncbi:MAG: diaminopimelate dehydrogenase [Clostridia bacterium]|nr:diaminopimelate dehydrogenase [Clostridia bacterium]
MINIAIAGYGNLGRGVEKAAMINDDINLVALLTRRDPSTIETASGIEVINEIDAKKLVGEIDVLVICGGSATDLPEMTPRYAKLFNTVDSFDTHAKIPEYFAAVDSAAKGKGHLSLISAGWDPGMFSLNRLYAESIIPNGKTYTFWGKGVSQGHSDAIRRINGVKRAVQYTVPVPEAIDAARSGENAELSTREKHTRVCFVVADEGADRDAIEQEIVTMPNYFAEYNTTVNFIDEDTFECEHRTMPHGGFVIRSGESSESVKQRIEYSLALDSNPEFTGSVLLCTARAVARMAKEGKTGAITMFDVPPAYLSAKNADELRAELL